MIRILGLDVGSVRVGVALSDPLGMTAQPLEVVDRRRADVMARVAALVGEHEVQKIVVGNPIQLNGLEGQASASIRAFVETLQKHVSVPIVLWDERMSTAQAQRVMIEGGARRDKRKERIDQLAAALILQSFLDSQGTHL